MSNALKHLYQDPQGFQLWYLASWGVPYAPSNGVFMFQFEILFSTPKALLSSGFSFSLML